MKALVLSGGKGTRLRPITHTSAKQLVPIANKPILFYALDAIKAAGIHDIGIIVGDTEPEIRLHVGDGSRWDARVAYIRQSAPLGLAHAVKQAQPYLQNEPFVMYLGDNIVRDGINPFVRQFERDRSDACILLAHVREPSRFGVAELNGGRVVGLEEKPVHPRSDLALVGVYIFGPRIFEAVNAITPSPRGELEITDAIQYLMTNGGNVQSHIIDGWWKDTGRIEDLLEANRFVLDALEPHCDGFVDPASRIIGKVVIEAGARVTASVVRGPAVIGRGSRIINSYIGPFTSICCDVEIVDSEVEHSIVMDHSKIIDAGVRIEESLIGRDVLIRRADAMPKAMRLMLGDHSEVQTLASA
jgi:glucose-1-phosphate thymidylyltransferase